MAAWAFGSAEPRQSLFVRPALWMQLYPRPVNKFTAKQLLREVATAVRCPAENLPSCSTAVDCIRGFFGDEEHATFRMIAGRYSYT
jgi:hypothetical protein